MKPIAITLGDPAGIGAEILLKAAPQLASLALVAFADRNLLAERAHFFKLPLPNNLSIHHVPLNEPSHLGEPNKANAHHVLETLKLAARACQEKKCSALVTGPVSKFILQEAGIPFLGHTEWLADFFHVKQTVMCFVSDRFKIALYTTHLPLSTVASTLDAKTLKQCLLILNRSLIDDFKIAKPRIVICGLNPHAGEAGYLGQEEQTIIKPVIDALNQTGLQLCGPVSADTAFTPDTLKNTDAVLAMYHDQGLPVVKALNFHDAVNITLGLPIIRTSVDHGTAFSIATMGNANPSSLIAAIRLAHQIASKQLKKRE